MAVEPNKDRPCWFVGARFGGKYDQTKDFLEKRIWKHDFSHPDHLAKVQPKVHSMQSGDRIAIKAFAGIVKNDLPFDNKQRRVPVMRIQATGVVSQNPDDGCRVEVEWDPPGDERKWYFYTSRYTIWKVSPNSCWKADALIAFTFDEKEETQNYDLFLA